MYLLWIWKNKHTHNILHMSGDLAPLKGRELILGVNHNFWILVGPTKQGVIRVTRPSLEHDSAPTGLGAFTEFQNVSINFQRIRRIFMVKVEKEIQTQPTYF